MISDVIRYVRENPANVAIVTAAGAYVLSFATRAWGTVRNWLVEQASSVLEHVSQDEDDVALLSAAIDACRLSAFSRRYALGRKNALVTGYGPGVARWRGTWILYTRTIDTEPMRPVETLRLRFMTRSRAVVAAFVAEATRDPDFEYVATRIFEHSGSDHGFHQVARRVVRRMDTVFANPGVRESIVERLDWFLANEAWYLRRGVNYKLVVFLHGPPGCGKTSLIQAIAAHMERVVYSVTNLDDLGRSALLLDNYVMVVEDMDTLGSLRRETPSTDIVPTSDGAISLGTPPLHGLLQTLDGLRTPHGLVVVITSNEPLAFDPALVRPGRVDLQVEVGPLGFIAAREMFGAYFGAEHVGIVDDLADSWHATTGAALQQALMPHLDPEGGRRALVALQESSR